MPVDAPETVTSILKVWSEIDWGILEIETLTAKTESTPRKRNKTANIRFATIYANTK